MKLSDQFKALDAGATFDEILNPEQNRAKLEQMYRNHKANQAKAKCRRKATRRPRPSKRQPSASSSLASIQARQADAMAEQVSRVNKTNLEDAPISVYAGGVLQMTIGG
jgi:hypothetical protein